MSMPLQEALMWVGIVVSSVFVYWYLRPDEKVTEAAAVESDVSQGEKDVSGGESGGSPYAEVIGGSEGVVDDDGDVKVVCEECGARNDFAFEFCWKCASPLGP